MQIEYPEFPPVALRARRVATIGAFYEAISTAFSAIEPAIDPNAHYVAYGGSVGQIRTIDDALAAIGRIKQEGEGTANSPDQPSINGERFAHYYMFKEIFEGRKLINTGGKWSFAGDMIRFPTVHNFTRSSASPNPSLAFNQQLAQLLTNLEACWTSGRLPDIDGMTQLQQQGIDLVQNGIRPDFVWAPSLLAKQMSG